MSRDCVGRFGRRRCCHRRRCRRAGLVLPIVLVLVGLLAITLAGFIFFVQAETRGMLAQRDGQQARLAAESGLEELLALLRLEPHNSKAWYNNPGRFRHALVWSEDYERDADPLRKGQKRAELLSGEKAISPAWRYSIVAPDYRLLPNEEPRMRFGLTPESSKLNLNTATDAQIEQLLLPLLAELEIDNRQELVNALLDWRDEDSEPREGGAESEYYSQLEPPYRPKNGPFDSLEELLLVKGFSPAVLYGEDTNRNGILDPNENDGDASFPLYDNADGHLNMGIAPFLTVWTREPDTALDNRPRINLNADPGVVAAQIAQYFQENELSPATIAFLTSGWRQQGVQIASPAQLYTEGQTLIDPAEADGPSAGPPTFTGTWNTTFGTMRLVQQEQQVSGVYEYSEGPSSIVGTVSGATLTFTYQEPSVSGEGSFQLAPDGRSFQGRWREEGETEETDWRPWEGTRIAAGGETGAGGSIQIQNSPITADELPYLMDRFTVLPPQVAATGILGLININTASERVLRVIPGMTPAYAAALVAARGELDENALRTTAWPVMHGVLTTDVWHAVAPYITTKAYQFHVEVLGYADHNKMMKRLEWIIEMIGPLGQVRYFRDLTELGPAWPIDDEKLEEYIR